MKRIIPENTNIVITVSYGNYIRGKGGTDKVIKAHQGIFNKNDISVMHLFRARSIGEKFRIKRTDIWRVLMDGNDCGLYSTSGLINAISDLQKDGFNFRDIFIHHLNNICMDQLIFLMKRIDAPIYFYIHD